MTHSLDDLANLVTSFCDRYGIARSTFGRAVMNDGNFVAQLVTGEREMRRATIDKVESYIAGFEAGKTHSSRPANEDRSASLTANL